MCTDGSAGKDFNTKCGEGGGCGWGGGGSGEEETESTTVYSFQYMPVALYRQGRGGDAVRVTNTSCHQIKQANKPTNKQTKRQKSFKANDQRSRTSHRLLVGCLTSQQHASVSQGRICFTSQQHASVSQGRICFTSQQHASVSQGRICFTSQQHASVSQGRICFTSQQHASVSQGRICFTSQQHASVSQGRICFTSQQHASVSQGRICSGKSTCCHTAIEVADPTFHLTQSQYTDTGPTSTSTDPLTPGAWQGNHWSANF